MNLILLVLLGMGVFFIWNQFYWQALQWPRMTLKIPRLQAHRGKHNAEVENSLAAFRAAKSAGAKMCELDVRVTKDFVPVIFHDESLQRLFGRNEKVQDLTLEDFRKIGTVPTLQDILMDADSPSMINIELKNGALWGSSFENAITKAVVDADATGRVMFSSFNPLSLRRLASCLPEVPRALLASREREPGNRIYLRQMWLAPYMKIHLLHLDHRFVTVSEVRKYKKRQIPVALWTVNDPEKARQFLDAGALSIISDKFMSESDLSSGKHSEKAVRDHERL